MLSVLVVDDSAVMRRMVKRSLEMAGLPLSRVFEAANGVAALTLLVSHRIDLVLSDVNMPEMDGVELVRSMSRANATKGVPVVIVSTERSEPRIDELLSHTATETDPPSRYALVIMAAKRARQINNYHHQLGEGLGLEDAPPPLVESRSKNYLTMAMEEISRGKLTFAYGTAAAS